MSALLRCLAGSRACLRLLRRPEGICSQRLRSSAAAAALGVRPHAASQPDIINPPTPGGSAHSVPPPPVVPFSMDSVNSVVVSGTTLTDPQVYYLPANQVAAHVRLGLRPRVVRAGLPQPPHGAVTVDAWGALALQLAQHVPKGSRIQVRGVLREDMWTDRATGATRYAIKIIAEELATVAPPEQHHLDFLAAEAAAASAQLMHEPPSQHDQPPMPQPPHHHPQQQQPRSTSGSFTSSGEVSRRMYEVEGLELEAIAAARRIKLSTVTGHLLAAGKAGAFSSWQRLARDLQLGPPVPGATWLSPAEVAEAIAAVQQDYPDTELRHLPRGPIWRYLAEGPATGAKVAQLEAGRGGNPDLTYACIELVKLMLEQGVSFSLVSSPPQAQHPHGQPGMAASGSLGQPPF